MSNVSKEECNKCECADNTISYSDWWYCKNPKDFRDFTVFRDGCGPRPEWCPKGLLERIESSVKIAEGYKKALPIYYDRYWKDQHELLLEIKEQLENGQDKDK